MKQWFINRFQYFPLSIFMAYALWNGEPSKERWLDAFVLSAIAGLVQLVTIAAKKSPANRLVLATNVYLILGGIAVFSKQWWYLQIYYQLKASAILLSMALIGLIATYFTEAGYLGVSSINNNKTKKFSMYLLLATVVCLGISQFFHGNMLLAGILPIVAVINLQLYLQKKLIKSEV